MTETKTCTKCGKSLPIDKFRVSIRQTKSGLKEYRMNICRRCCHKAQDAWKDKHKPTEAACKRCGEVKPLSEYRQVVCRPGLMRRAVVCMTCDAAQAEEEARKLEERAERKVRRDSERLKVKPQHPRSEWPRRLELAPTTTEMCKLCGSPLSLDQDGQSYYCPRVSCSYRYYPPVSAPIDDPELVSGCRSLNAGAGNIRFGEQVCAACGKEFYGSCTKTRCPRCEHDWQLIHQKHREAI